MKVSTINVEQGQKQFFAAVVFGEEGRVKKGGKCRLSCVQEGKQLVGLPSAGKLGGFANMRGRSKREIRRV